MTEDIATPIRDNYNVLAEDYARELFNELQHKPLDRSLLDRFASRIPENGDVCDMGCGPGHVTRYLQLAGANVWGLDLLQAWSKLRKSLAQAFISASETCSASILLTGTLQASPRSMRS